MTEENSLNTEKAAMANLDYPEKPAAAELSTKSNVSSSQGSLPRPERDSSQERENEDSKLDEEEKDKGLLPLVKAQSHEPPSLSEAPDLSGQEPQPENPQEKKEASEEDEKPSEEAKSPASVDPTPSEPEEASEQDKIEDPEQDAEEYQPSSLIDPEFICQVCYSNVERKQAQVEISCSHTFCRDCFTDYLSYSLEGEAEIPLKCPVDDCASRLELYEIGNYASQSIYHKYRMKEAVPCPNEKCPQLCFELKGTLWCIRCEIRFCSSCKLQEHPKLTCKEKQDLAYQSRRFQIECEEKEKKKCPSCGFKMKQNPSQRGITCICGTTFCGECSNDWDVHIDGVCPKQEEALQVERDEDKELEDKGGFFCPICMEVYPDLKSWKKLDCGHRFCKECLARVITTFVDSGQFPIVCPDPKCKKDMRSDVATLVDTETYSRYSRLQLKRDLQAMGGMMPCFTPDCEITLEVDPSVRVFSCPQCKKEYCIPCKADHSGKTCREHMASQRLQDAEEVKEFIDSRKCIQCPQCKFWVEKKEGCNHMTCHCGFHFCYKCGRPWDNHPEKCHAPENRIQEAFQLNRGAEPEPRLQQQVFEQPAPEEPSQEPIYPVYQVPPYQQFIPRDEANQNFQDFDNYSDDGNDSQALQLAIALSLNEIEAAEAHQPEPTPVQPQLPQYKEVETDFKKKMEDHPAKSNQTISMIEQSERINEEKLRAIPVKPDWLVELLRDKEEEPGEEEKMPQEAEVSEQHNQPQELGDDVEEAKENPGSEPEPKALASDKVVSEDQIQPAGGDNDDHQNTEEKEENESEDEMELEQAVPYQELEEEMEGSSIIAAMSKEELEALKNHN